MQRKKILWLVSWYPNKDDRFDGDFIQRHARAAAIYHDIHLIFVTSSDSITAPEEVSFATGLTEEIIYFRRPYGLLSTFKKMLHFNRLFREAVDKYITKYGLPEGIHVHIPWKAGLVGLWAKEKYKIPFLLSEHWGGYSQRVEHNYFERPVAVRKLMKKIYEEARTLVTVSRFLGNEIKAAIDREADVLIPNVVDTTLFFNKREKYSKFSFIHVSNMVPLKNITLILEAFKQMLSNTGRSDIQLIMVGNRDDHYVKMAAAMGLLNQSVFFRGEISYADVADEMKRSHSMVLYSDSETFSCVTAEALCAGLPVIAADVGALPELVNQSNGILVQPGNKEALVAALQKMVDNYSAFNPESISGVASGKYGYARIAEDFDRLYEAYC